MSWRLVTQSRASASLASSSAILCLICASSSLRRFICQAMRASTAVGAIFAQKRATPSPASASALPVSMSGFFKSCVAAVIGGAATSIATQVLRKSDFRFDITTPARGLRRRVAQNAQASLRRADALVQVAGDERDSSGCDRQMLLEESSERGSPPRSSEAERRAREGERPQEFPPSKNRLLDNQFRLQRAGCLDRLEDRDNAVRLQPDSIKPGDQGSQARAADNGHLTALLARIDLGLGSDDRFAFREGLRLGDLRRLRHPDGQGSMGDRDRRNLDILTDHHRAAA